MIEGTHVRPGVERHPGANVINFTFPHHDRALTRYFIVTHGRSGSTLLAAILSACEAPFGPECAKDSDTERDHWESHTIERAIRCAHNANEHFTPAMAGFRRATYRFWRSRAKSLLSRALRQAVFSKNRWNTTVLPLAEKLGYRPVPIISYRHPGEVALSDMNQLKNSASTFLPLIIRTYTDALYALERYGGVVIDHSELIDPSHERWAYALDAVTGIDADRLLKARNALLRPRRPRDQTDVWLPSELRALAQNLSSLRNRPLPPSSASRDSRS